MARHHRRVSLGIRIALMGAMMATGCGRCSSATPAPSPLSSAPASPPADAAVAITPPVASADVPEVRDTGFGRATAGLRALFMAYGVEVDAGALERECDVDEDGASIDDLEDVANEHGLDARQVILPVEHVGLPEAKLLPALVIVEGAKGAGDGSQFVVAWRVEGDRVRIMDPSRGRDWMDRAALQRSLYVHEMAVPIDEWRTATESTSFQDGLKARMAALGIDSAASQPWMDTARADTGWRGFGALDAAVRWIAGSPSRAPADRAPALGAAFACAFEKHCDAGAPSIPPNLWSVRAAPKGLDGEERVMVRGTPALLIAGRRAVP